VDKPSDWTSFDVVAKLRKELHWRKVGHAGTLDPAATGVLLLLIGDATRRSDEFMDLPKEYRATIRLGLCTSTDDLTGDAIEQIEIGDWSEERIQEQLRRMTGAVLQAPPAVSAIKIKGERSYRIARQGREVAPEPRTIRIDSIEVTAIRKPDVDVIVRCGRGTYIRSIARDLGRALGWGGTLASLRRTAVGPYRSEAALAIDEILKRRCEFRHTV